MSELFDTQPLIEAIEQAEDLLELDGLPPDRSRLEAGDRSVLFADDMPGGITIAGEKDVLVRGSVCGKSGNPCRIEIAGDLVVTGEMTHAHVRCRSLRTGGTVRNCQLVTVGDIVSGGDLLEAQLALGDFREQRRRLEELQRLIIRTREEREILDRSIHQDEKRMARSCKATRIPLKFSLNRLIYHDDDRVRIDLSSIFGSLENHSEERFRLALNEFFAKGMVGFLAKANHRYIDQNPAREKVFLQLLKKLRELFVQVAERENAILQIRRAETEIKEIEESLRNKGSTVSVRGALQPEIRLKLVLPILQKEEELLKVTDSSISLKLTPGGDEEQFRLTRTDTAGEATDQAIAAGELQGITLYPDDGQIAYRALTPTPA